MPEDAETFKQGSFVILGCIQNGIKALHVWQVEGSCPQSVFILTEKCWQGRVGMKCLCGDTRTRCTSVFTLC